MADEHNTPLAGEGNLRIEGRRLIFGMRILLESVSLGLEALQTRPEALFIKEELVLLRRLSTQAAEAVEAFGEMLVA